MVLAVQCNTTDGGMCKNTVMQISLQYFEFCMSLYAVTGSPLGELPGPVDDRNDPGRRKMTVGLIASVVTIAASSVIVAVGVLYLAVRRSELCINTILVPCVPNLRL